jgi:hypothetical protein
MGQDHSKFLEIFTASDGFNIKFDKNNFREVLVLTTFLQTIQLYRERLPLKIVT